MRIHLIAVLIVDIMIDEIFETSYQTIMFAEEESIFVGDYSIRKIQYQEALPFILKIHYAKRVPSTIQYVYGLFNKKNLVGIVAYSIPASASLCEGIAGKNNKHLVLELSRLVLKNNKKNEASILVSSSLKLLPKPKIIVSYADTAQDHVGYIYQATNFIYLGLSAKRTDRVFIDGTKQKHGRHVISTDVKNIKERTVLVARPRKHRYMYVIGSKTEKKNIMKQLRYKKLDYPK